MKRNLLITLIPPAGDPPPDFRVEIDADNATIGSMAGFDSSDVDDLKAALQVVEGLIPKGLELFHGFPKVIEKHRAEGNGSDMALALFLRISIPDSVTTSTVSDAEAAFKGVSIVKSIEEVGHFTTAHDVGQDYLAAPSDGVNVMTFWNAGLSDVGLLGPAGRGGNVTVCLIDEGYQKLHPHFQDSTCGFLGGLESSDDVHGTRMLGILAPAGSDAPRGIAHKATFWVSVTTRDGSEELEVLGDLPVPVVVEARDAFFAIDDALVVLDEGDVLLLGLQTIKQEPMEVHADLAKALRFATDRGITVIEPAGNGVLTLVTEDLPLEEAVPADLDDDERIGPADGTAADSGAIIIGANDFFPNGPESLSSNYGQRVTCYSWGTHILTTDNNSGFVHNFGGSSGASAIVAGLVTVVQSLYIEATGKPLTPWQLRDAFHVYPTAPRQTPEFIGPHPDLLAILRRLRLLPDIYLRDNPDDDGDESTLTTSIWQSPDIITRPSPVTEGQRRRMEDRNINDMARAIVPEAVNYIYLRAANRGLFGHETTFKLYWAHPGTFLNRAGWTTIGELKAEVPGGTLVPGGNINGDPEVEIGETVVGPFEWLAPSADEVTTPCFIATADTVFDPEPTSQALVDAGGYIDFVRSHNNIAHRNVKVAEIAADGGPVVEPPDDDANSPDTDHAGDGQDAAFWRFNVQIPLIRRARPTRLKILLGAHVPDSSTLVIGLPAENEFGFRTNVPEAIETAELNKRLLDHGDDAPRLVERWLRRPEGDRRQLEEEPSRWIHLPVGKLKTREIVLAQLRTRIGANVRLVVGILLRERLETPSDFAIDVVQELAGGPVGRVNLRLAYA